ncbi:hypothetical protein O0544_12350 [Edwardsiella anguillarum]|nr:hypothetical protein [Edwardsiella anguillarum]
MQTLARNNATLAMTHGMSLASGIPLASSRYSKILTPTPMAITLVIPQLDEDRFEGELALDSVRIEDVGAVTAFLYRAGLSQNRQATWLNSLPKGYHMIAVVREVGRLVSSTLMEWPSLLIITHAKSVSSLPQLVCT